MSNSEEKKKPGEQPNEEVHRDLEEILDKLSETDQPRAPREPEKKMLRPEKELEKITPKGGGTEAERLEDLLDKLSETPAEETEPVEELGVFERIVGVFTSPEKVFRYLARKPDIWVPLLISIFIGILVSTLVYDIAINDQIQRIEQNDNIPDDRKEMIIDSMESRRTGSWKVISISVLPALGILVMFSFVSLVFWFTGNVILGGKATFKQIFSVYGYSYLIYGILGTVVSLPLILAKKTIQVQLGLANFLPASMSHTFLYHFFSKVDVFTLWTAVVFGIGFSVVYRMPRARGIATVLAVWLLYALASAFLGTRLSVFGA